MRHTEESVVARNRDEHRARRGGVVLVALAIAGCSRPLVDPGPSRPMGSVPPVQSVPGAPQAAGPAGAAPAGTVPASDLSQVPRVPASAVLTAPTDPSAAPVYHEVVRGDTLSAIARRYETTVEKLLAANGLDRASILRPGQLILVRPAR
jgi:nucleoid-associated protein YgaU